MNLQLLLFLIGESPGVAFCNFWNHQFHVLCPSSPVKKDSEKLKINLARCFGNRISPSAEAKSKVRTYLAGCVVAQLVGTFCYKVKDCGFNSQRAH
jgi:hypothetical protein